MEANAKLETLSAILKQEKEQFIEKLNSQKEKNEEDRQVYESKILELKEMFERRLNDHENWSKKFENNNEQIFNAIEMIKNDEYVQPTKKKNQPKNEISTDFNKELISHLKEVIREMREIKIESLENKVLHEKEKELRDVEKKFLRQINDAKILSENTLETVKKSFYNEIQLLKVI